MSLTSVVYLCSLCFFVVVTTLSDRPGVTLWLDWMCCLKAEFRAEVRSVLRVLLMFVPLPLFHALFDQQVSHAPASLNKSSKVLLIDYLLHHHHHLI